MEATRRQKIQNAICTAIEYGAATFMLLLALAFSLMFLACLTQIFQEPISIIGCLGFGGAAWFLWAIITDTKTR